MFRERKTGMFSFGALPTLKLEHGGNTGGTSLLDLKHQLSGTAAVRHEISREKRLAEVRELMCKHLSNCLTGQSNRRKHAHAAGFHSFFGPIRSADAPF